MSIIKEMPYFIVSNPTHAKNGEYILCLRSSVAYRPASIGIITTFISYLFTAIQQGEIKRLLKLKPPDEIFTLNIMACTASGSEQMEFYNYFAPISDLKSLAACFFYDLPEDVLKKKNIVIKTILNKFFWDLKNQNLGDNYLSDMAVRFQQSITIYNENGIKVKEYTPKSKHPIGLNLQMVKYNNTMGMLISQEFYSLLENSCSIEYCRICSKIPTIICYETHIKSIISESSLLDIVMKYKRSELLDKTAEDIKKIPNTDYYKMLYEKSIISRFQSHTQYIKSTINIKLTIDIIDKLTKKYASTVISQFDIQKRKAETFLETLKVINGFSFPSLD